MLPKDSKARLQWSSKEDVLNNVHNLGRGVSVFFIYAPDPVGQHSIAHGKPGEQEKRSRVLMSMLFHDLEVHGFHVMSDLHLGDTEPSNWLLWYITRIQECNFVVFVCSPAFKQLFEAGRPDMDTLTDRSRRLLEYRDALYVSITENKLSGEGKRKFLPVILDRFEVGSSVPLLFRAGTVYQVAPEGEYRRFDYDNRVRDFEKMVCYIAGINRDELDRKGLERNVPVLGSPFAAGMCM